MLKAIEEGELTEVDVDTAAENVLTLVQRTKGDDMSPEEAEREDDREETRTLMRQAGAEGITLLKNEAQILPINPRTAKVAVIGPNANRPIAGGGGSASLNPYYNTLPLDSIRALAQQEVLYAEGCHIHKWLPVASPYCTTKAGRPGVTLEWFRGDKFRGEVAVTQRRKNTDLFLWDSAPLAELGPQWSAIATTCLTSTATGKHTISFMSVGPGRLYIDGKLALDLWDWTEEGEAMFDGSVDYLVDVEMQAGRPVELRVEMTNELRPVSKQKQFNMTHRYGGCRIGFKEVDQVDYLQEAINVAKEADIAVVIVGLDAEWESEGYDRQTMDLPKDGSQDRLVEAIVKANPRTVVVNQSGSPVTMPWVDSVPAIIQAWYQGQEAGNALADVLFGLQNPSGKLPVSLSCRRTTVYNQELLTNHAADHISPEDRGHAGVAQLARREHQGSVRRGPVHRIPTLRPGAGGAAVPVRARAILHDLRVRAAVAEQASVRRGRRARPRPGVRGVEPGRHGGLRDSAGVRARRPLPAAAPREGARRLREGLPRARRDSPPHRAPGPLRRRLLRRLHPRLDRRGGLIQGSRGCLR